MRPLVAFLSSLTTMLVASSSAPRAGIPPRPGPEVVAPPVVAEPEPLPLPVSLARFSPEGDRHRRDVPIEIAFDGPVDRGEVERALAIDPPAELAVTFLDDRTLVARPKALSFGTMYRVTVGGTSAQGLPIAPYVGSFRTAVPPPARVFPGDGARVVLTFDDGTRTRTDAVRLLDLLARLEIRAILFPTGNWATAHPDLVARAHADGHLVCNHTRTHRNLTTLGDADVASEIVGGAGRGTCSWLRPPSMGTSPRVEAIAERLGYRLMLWDIDSRDWEGLPAEDLVNLTLGAVHPGSIVLFHMHSPHVLEALPTLAARLRGAGYVLSHDGTERRADAPVVAPRLGRSSDARRVRRSWDHDRLSRVRCPSR